MTRPLEGDYFALAFWLLTTLSVCDEPTFHEPLTIDINGEWVAVPEGLHATVRALRAKERTP